MAFLAQVGMGCRQGQQNSRAHACLSSREQNKETGSLAGPRILVQSSTLPLICCVTLGRFLTLSVLGPSHRVAMRLSGIRPSKQLEHVWAWLEPHMSEVTLSRRTQQASETSTEQGRGTPSPADVKSQGLVKHFCKDICPATSCPNSD